MQELFSEKGFNLAKRAAKNTIGRSLAKIAAENATTLYKKGALQGIEL